MAAHAGLGLPSDACTCLGIGGVTTGLRDGKMQVMEVGVRSELQNIVTQLAEMVVIMPSKIIFFLICFSSSFGPFFFARKKNQKKSEEGVATRPKYVTDGAVKLATVRNSPQTVVGMPGWPG